jgi:hypothetical protein
MEPEFFCVLARAQLNGYFSLLKHDRPSDAPSFVGESCPCAVLPPSRDGIKDAGNQGRKGSSISWQAMRSWEDDASASCLVA